MWRQKMRAWPTSAACLRHKSATRSVMSIKSVGCLVLNEARTRHSRIDSVDASDSCSILTSGLLSVAHTVCGRRALSREAVPLTSVAGCAIIKSPS